MENQEKNNNTKQQNKNQNKYKDTIQMFFLC